MVKTVTRYFPANEIGLPAVVVQVTCWIGSYMIWAGTTDEAIDEQDTTRITGLVEQGRLGQDWACAMPSPKPSIPVTGTALLRSNRSALAISMSQRLAQRFKKQYFVSIDILPSHSSMGQESVVALTLEQQVVKTLTEIEQ